MKFAVPGHHNHNPIDNMPSLEAGPDLSVEEIDDVLYLTRVNETGELQQTTADLANKHNCSPHEVLLNVVDPKSQNTVLHYASANGFLDLIKSFLAPAGGSGNSSAFINRANSQGNTALHWAAYNGHLDVVKALITAGANMWIKNAAGHLAMFEAERAERSEVAQYLLEVGGNRVEQGGSETQASAEDVADVDAGAKDSPSGSNGHMGDS